MLDVINRLSHGYVAIPIIRALEDREIFAIMERDGPLSIDELTTRAGANEGHLRVALRMLRGLGWLTVRDGCVALTPQAAERRFIPLDITIAYTATSPVKIVDQDFTRQMAAHLAQSLAGWHGADPRTVDLLDGAVLLPALHALHGLCGSGMSGLRQFADPVRIGLTRLLQARGWAKVHGRHMEPTDAGKFLLQRIPGAGTILSYRPMLARIDDVIFGDCQSVFARDQDGNEGHVDRTLNVMASGFQHEQFFAEAVDIILDVFRHTPLADQPHYIMDTGCGDGSLLHTIYNAICERTPRGMALDQFPLTLIAVDLNEDARKAAARTFQDIPHILLAGDISDPAAIIQNVRAHGVKDPEQILHVRSFLDHERAFQTPHDHFATSPNSEAVSVARDGSWIPPEKSNSNLVEFLQRWGPVVGRHGLVALEVHCLSADSANRHFDEAESLFFDTYHGFSGQHLVEPEVYLLAAASAGLFSRQKTRRFPKQFSFTRITLHHFERRNIQVRRARETDLDAACEIDHACWPNHLRTPLNVLEQRIRTLAHEQFVASIDGRVVGILYTQRINPDALGSARWQSVDALRDETGSALQLLGITVLPSYRSKDVGLYLQQLVLEWARCCDGIESVVGVSRCSEFQSRQPGLPDADSMLTYCHALNEDGQSLDPTLRFHTGGGAEIVGIIEGYNPADADNGGFGVRIEYNLRDIEDSEAWCQSEHKGRDLSASPAPAHEDQRLEVLNILNSVRPDGVGDTAQPFMEMGLNSVELLAVRARLAKQFNRKLESAFLFRHNTVEAVVSALSAEKKQEHPQDMPGIPSPTPASLTDDRIAVVGLACRFPCGNAEAFWRLLRDGRDSIGRIPPDRETGSARHGGHSTDEQGGYVEGIDKFDAHHFRITPLEARLMDPQQRILMELAWELFEDAGQNVSAVRGTATGVWIGACHFEYRDVIEKSAEAGSHLASTGNHGAILANRLSYFYDLRGPSLAVDTACSSSLVAVHLAAQAIRQGDCQQAVVGGVNLICSSSNTVSFRNAGILSPTGRCRPFGKDADGYARGEGAGLVLLKPLSQAIADGDQVYGLVCGSAVNHGGTTSALTAPSPQAQADVIVRAHRQAEFDPATVAYIEAHGTGTALGDPIEMAGLQEAFDKLAATKTAGRDEGRWLVGSVKSNIGHLEGAAGIAGMIKVLLAFRHGLLPPSLYAGEPNHEIDFANGRFQIVQSTTTWTAQDHRAPRRAGVSSFGFGGVGAHVALEEFAAPERLDKDKRPGMGKRPVIISLSAQTSEKLVALARSLLDRVQEDRSSGFSGHSLADIAWTLQRGREPMPERLAFVANSVEDMMEKLQAFVARTARAEPEAPGTTCRTIACTQVENVDCRDIVRQALDRGDLRKIAATWAAGAAIDWTLMWPGARPGIVSLPTYPFAGDSYWVTPIQG